MSIVFAISGAFRSGKSSVVNRVCKLLDGLVLAISYTTRTRLTIEEEGSEFFFTSHEVFERLIASEEFLEYESILGNYYGTPRHYLQQARDNGKDLLIEVDDRGVAQIKQKIPDAVSILVVPGEPARETHTFGSVMEPRIQAALLAALVPSFDKYDHVIVNNRLEDTANKLIEIIRSERLRRS
jgi:guanylate kinase